MAELTAEERGKQLTREFEHGMACLSYGESARLLKLATQALRDTEAATWEAAAKMVMDYNLDHNHGRKATDMCDALFDLLNGEAAKARQA